MKTHEFYQAYANTPLSERLVLLDFKHAGLTTLNDIYQEMHALENQIRPTVIRINELLRLAEEHYARQEKK